MSALVIWVVSLVFTSRGPLNGYGLLGVLNPVWFVAVGIVVGCALAMAMRGARGQRMAVASVTLLVVMLHATPPLLYETVRYTWTYKHFGVIRYIDATHTLPRLADIYYNWPGFFTASSLLGGGASLSPEQLAVWAPLAFELLNLSAVRLLAASLTKDSRRASLATLIFVVSAWVGQDYFAPQALDFFLGIVAISLFIRLHGNEGESVAPAGRRRAYLALGVVWLAVVTTHQLTPVIVLTTAVAVTVVSARRRWRIAVATLLFMGLTEVIWVILAYPYLSKSPYSLFDFNPFQGSRLPQLTKFPPEAGVAFRTHSVQAIYFGLFGVAFIFAAMHFRRQVSERMAGAAAFGPPVVLVLQDYGGEGQLRTYLFASPFLAFLVAGAALQLGRRLKRRRLPMWTVPAIALVIVLSLFLPAYYGQEAINRVGVQDVKPVEWFYVHAPHGSEPIYLAPNVPSRFESNYLDFPLQADAFPALITSERFLLNRNAKSTLDYLASIRAAHVYLIITPSQVAYTEYFGILDHQKYEQLLQGLLGQTALRLRYRSGDSVVFEYAP